MNAPLSPATLAELRHDGLIPPGASLPSTRLPLAPLHERYTVEQLDLFLRSAIGAARFQASYRTLDLARLRALAVEQVELVDALAALTAVTGTP